MGLQGLRDYLNEHFRKSVFDDALNSGDAWEMHLHGRQIVNARVLEDLVYDVRLDIEGQGEQVLPKIHIKMLYPVEQSKATRKLIKTDKKVQAKQLGPIEKPEDRHIVKNKSLYPLMTENEVVFFTLLEGEIIRGLIAGFRIYDLTVSLKGGIPVTIMRHSIYDLRNKQGRCFLKSFQQEHRDWQKSPLFSLP